MIIDSKTQSSAGVGKEADAPELLLSQPVDAGSGDELAALRSTSAVSCLPDKRPLVSGELLPAPGSWPRAALRNVRMMHCLERVAAKFNEAGVPLMVLKGAALNLTVHHRPDERPMGDLDVLVRPEDVGRAFRLLEQLGGLRGEPLVREDFFPRYHYEMEYTAGRIYPVKIDLHVRPFRPLRYSRLVPRDALWARAREVRMGAATVLVPAPEDMLIHLCAHVAIHGFSRSRWLDDIKRWADAWQGEIDWGQFVQTAVDWCLVLPVRQALRRVEERLGAVCPPDALRRLGKQRVGWRDRLALRQAPRDGQHPVAHVTANVLCTPGWRFVLGYLLAVAFPDRMHMAVWYGRAHRGWLVCAHALRFAWPAVKRIRPLWTWLRKVEARESGVHGIGVFATREISVGEFIAAYQGRPVDHHGPYVGYCETRKGKTQRYEITGKLRYLNHSCNPNAELRGFKLVALRPISAGKEVMIDYTNGTCSCREGVRTAKTTSSEEKAKVADAA